MAPSNLAAARALAYIDAIELQELIHAMATVANRPAAAKPAIRRIAGPRTIGFPPHLYFTRTARASAPC